MIDPQNITNFNASTYQLQEMLLFWVLAAGKNSKTAARSLDKFLQGNKKPFHFIRQNYKGNLPKLREDMQKAGIGCMSLKGRTFYELALARPNLRSIDLKCLMTFPGIGPKTARCFLIHSRQGARYAGLDTHILKWMRSKGLDVPKSTPQGKRYLYWEREFLKLKDKLHPNISVADFDLEIWKKYAR